VNKYLNFSDVKHTYTQPFYGSVEFVRDNPGAPVPEETFIHSDVKKLINTYITANSPD